jgi:hypothetical protein
MIPLSLVPVCLHCERAPQSQAPRVKYLRLCDGCGAVAGLRRVYRRPPGWTPAWDAHMQRLVERARLGLPVRIDEPGYLLPTPPDDRAKRKRRRRWPRLFRVALRNREIPE